MSSKLAGDGAAPLVSSLDYMVGQQAVESFLQTAYDAIIIVNEQRKIVFANRQTNNWFGYEPAELVGQTLEVLIPERFCAQHIEKHNVYLKNPVSRPMGRMLNIVARRKDGSEFPADISLSPFQTKHGILTTAFIRDITESKRLADQERFLLKTSQMLSETIDYQERIQGTVDAMVPELADLCAIYVAEDGKLIPKAIAHSTSEDSEFFWNAARAYCEAERRDSALGPNFVMRTGKPQLIEKLADDLIGPELPNSVSFDQIKNLNIRSYMAVPMFVRGRPIGVISFSRVAPKSYTDKDLAFAERVAFRSAFAIDNSRLYKEAQDSIRLREDVLAIVSHDLKSPLATIAMSNDLIKGELQKSPDQSQVQKMTEIIERSARQMNRLITDLLDFAKIESGRLSVAPGVFSVNTFIENGLTMVQHHAKKKGISFEVNIQAGLPLIHYDLDRITQVLYNLVGNAIKFSPENGTVKVRALAKDSDILFSVEDEGPGIAKENLKLIFEKYWQVRQTGETGSGLGLYIAKRIVEAHGGRIWAESEIGNGTKCYFSLPTAHGPYAKT
ncbi:MAG: ATP-binding protein [Bdellovibrionales bacterium]